jgi:transmembrane sensor
MELLPRYFANEASPNERLEVESWRSESELNRKEFDAFAKLWDITISVSDKKDIDINKEWNKMESVISPAKGKIISLGRVLRVAASIVLLISLSYAGYRLNSTKSEKSPVSEMKSFKLPDGTLISLNANSKISYNKGFGKDHRKLTLKGEAYFEVAKNPNLPFIISADGASIQVVGTKFNVKAYKAGAEIKVLVKEGTVKLFETAEPEKVAILNAGETGTFDKTLKVVKKQVSANENDIAWKTLVLDFNNSSLDEVAQVLRNTYHTDIEVDPKVKDCPITVHFEQKDFESVLEVLRSTLELKITSEGHRIIISGKGC